MLIEGKQLQPRAGGSPENDGEGRGVLEGGPGGYRESTGAGLRLCGVPAPRPLRTLALRFPTAKAVVCRLRWYIDLCIIEGSSKEGKESASLLDRSSAS